MYINPKTGFVRGTQSFPRGRDTVLACLIIPRSGPTDRDGNNGNILQTNMYKMMSDSLAARGYAVLRYDKHGVGESREVDFSEYAITFESYVKDAAWPDQDDEGQPTVQQGGGDRPQRRLLIGMLAADSSGADAFISLEGAGTSADSLILNQLKVQQLTIYEDAARITQRLKAGQTVDTVPPFLQAVYRPQIQNYLRSWFRYHPVAEIQKMKIPVLIVQGSTDIQTTPAEGRAPKAAKPDAEYLYINGMNHVLKLAPTDRGMNLATYFNKDAPLHPN